mmetsp:Transcript_17732/g.23112  ORF Transcript_17732/g.23112 Transcript_17732/m.23112 type:complete len:131 (-) Transcript_17732:322-714(-)
MAAELLSLSEGWGTLREICNGYQQARYLPKETEESFIRTVDQRLETPFQNLSARLETSQKQIQLPEMCARQNLNGKAFIERDQGKHCNKFISCRTHSGTYDYLTFLKLITSCGFCNYNNDFPKLARISWQ